MGHEKTFRSEKAYAEFLRNNPVFQEYQILLPKSSMYLTFLREQINGKENSIPFLGAYVNDSMRITESDFLKAERTCPSRIINEIENLFAFDKDSISTAKTTPIDRYLLHVDERILSPHRAPSSPPIHLYFVYATGFGTIYDKLYKDIGKLAKEHPHELQLYLIGIDPIILKP